jgi:large subunit ribosomal protein L10
MNKEQKQAAVAEIGEQLEASSAIFAVDYRGISVPQAAVLRAKLREADASFSVVKNRLAKRITADAGAETLDQHLVGPTALTYVRGDAVIAAKAISEFIKEHRTLAYKGGIMDGEPLEPEQFFTIARLPGLDVLRGQLVAMTAAPLTGVVRTLNGLISGLASQLGQIAEQGLVAGADAEPEQTPAAEESEQAEPTTEEDPEDAAEASADSAGDELENETENEPETETKED